MYTLILKKGKIELELTTDDKYAVAKQLDLIIHQASGTTATAQVQEAVNTYSEPETPPLQVQEEVRTEVQQNTEEREPAENVQPAVFEHITKEEQQSAIVNKEDIIPQSIDIAPVKPLTINSLQNPEPEPQPDFDKILTSELDNHSDDIPVDKDERFIQYVEGKSALDKLDFLVITAQYLAQYENMYNFNLKHINAKLMQNFTLIVDHSILQSAISRDYIAQIHKGQDDTSSEYMLTEKGLRSY